MNQQTAEIHYLPDHRQEYALRSTEPEKSIYWHFCQARDYRAVAMEAEKQKEFHLDKVKDNMKFRERLTILSEKGKKLLATWKWHTRTVFSEEKLKEKYPEIWEECLEEVEVRTFLFK